jgi:hypothetical protein
MAKMIPQCSHRYTLTNEQTGRLRGFGQRTVLLPNSNFLAAWDMVMFISLIAIGIIEPYVFVFGIMSVSYEVFYWTSSACYVADTCIHFFRAQRQSTRDGVVLVTDLSEIARIYMEDWTFYIDVFSALPVSLIVTLLGLQRTFAGRILSGVRMIRLLKFARLPGLIHRVHDVLGTSFSLLSIFQFGLMSCMVLHWIACLWASLGNFQTNSWLHKASAKYQFLEFSDHRDMYLMSLYWSVTVLSSVGFGDIVPQQRSEFIIAIVCMFIGGTVWAYVVGSVCGLVTSMDKHRNAFESLVNDVNTMCTERNFPAKLQQRVWDYYQHAKEFMRMKEYHGTIRDLSPALKGEVVSWMYGRCFKRVWYFDVVDERCARILVEGMVPKMYAPEEWIEDTVDHGTRCLVFLRSGLCVRKCNLLAPGACWGLDVILGSEEAHDIEELLDRELARSINFAFVLKLSKCSIDHAATLIPAFARRLRKAHLRMLFWRGVIAATKAEKILKRKEELNHSATPTWDRMGRKMAQVVHMDALLLEEAQTGEHRHHPCLSRHSSHNHGRERAPTRTISSPDVLSRKSSLAPKSTPRRYSSTGNMKESRELSVQSREGSRQSSKDSVVPVLRKDLEISTTPQRQHSAENDEIPQEKKVMMTPEESNKQHEPALVPHVNGVKTPNGVMSPTLTEALNLAEGSAKLVNGRFIPVQMQECETPTPLPPQGEESNATKRESLASGVSVETTSPCENGEDTPLNWKEHIERRLEDVNTNVMNAHEFMSEEVESLREEVADLTKMMHQLLSRFDAEEKY